MHAGLERAEAFSQHLQRLAEERVFLAWRLQEEKKSIYSVDDFILSSLLPLVDDVASVILAVESLLAAGAAGEAGNSELNPLVESTAPHAAP
ncbi:hypothetical protein TcBrA4_0090760 [Trypanosoma cruzi]|nr:hypothetical protein TcBrA4_0090760 [Trypanosoma cruzi]